MVLRNQRLYPHPARWTNEFIGGYLQEHKQLQHSKAPPPQTWVTTENTCITGGPPSVSFPILCTLSSTWVYTQQPWAAATQKGTVGGVSRKDLVPFPHPAFHLHGWASCTEMWGCEKFGFPVLYCEIFLQPWDLNSQEQSSLCMCFIYKLFCF